MVFDLVAGELIDPHHGQEDLESRQLRLLHGTSVQDDPTRVIRAARYAARLGFQLAEESREQIRSTAAQWPWAWSQGDAAVGTAGSVQSPADGAGGFGTGTMASGTGPVELWEALPLLDTQLQQDPRRTERLRWARRLGLPLMPAFPGAADPVAVAQRLQIPGKQQQWLQQCGAIRHWLLDNPVSAGQPVELVYGPGTTGLEA